MRDGDDHNDLTIYDTPLHDPVELIDFRSPKGLVIYHPDMEREKEWLRSDVYFDTYERR